MGILINIDSFQCELMTLIKLTEMIETFYNLKLLVYKKEDMV